MTSQATETMSHAPRHPRAVMRSARGCARLLAGLALFLVAPVWLGIAVSVGASHSMLWPTWYAWVATLAGIGLWVRGWMLRGFARENIRKASDEWEALEKRHLEVERAFLPLLVAGRYDRGLTARLEAARAERENLRARIAADASFPLLASLSAATARETETIVGDFHTLMDAHVAMLAACDLFTLTPAWRRVWENELGPVYEDLTVVETITQTVQSRSMDPMVLSMAASLILWLDEQRLAVNDLGASLERAQMDPAEALTQLDRIADEARVRLVRLVEAALGADTSMIGRRRYKRWRKGAGEKLRTNETRYLGAYRIAGVTYTYNPAQAIRLTANSAGIDLKGSAAHSTARFMAFGAELYVPPAYLHRYLVWDGTSRYGSSRANYLTSAANVGPLGRTR
ncbi:DUF5129 domain-containing protein [Xylanimonas cellulosilytica]|uniref:DUF5129 domain-containing protein n=1 Tax=Xylanimonas cellulosilytica TaxID=186189 RepID=UPI0019553F4E|nr:DUF5129 domain-containing protein [Xylanimonas cellulosilytica]